MLAETVFGPRKQIACTAAAPAPALAREVRDVILEQHALTTYDTERTVLRKQSVSRKVCHRLESTLGLGIGM